MLMRGSWAEKQAVDSILTKKVDKTMTSIPKTEISSFSFEEAITELETIVRKLEDGRLPLEEAITAYEKGAALKSHCETKLRSAKLRVDQITLSASANQEPTLKPFDPETP